MIYNCNRLLQSTEYSSLWHAVGPCCLFFIWQCVCFPGGSDGKKKLACNAGDPGLIPRLGRSPEEGNGNPLRILAWRIPWTEEPGGLQCTGSQSWTNPSLLIYLSPSLFPFGNHNFVSYVTFHFRKILTTCLEKLRWLDKRKRDFPW